MLDTAGWLVAGCVQGVEFDIQGARC
jgi:hypothetical protein